MGNLLGALRRRVWQPSLRGRNAVADKYVERATFGDGHLVMNTLNQLAAHFQAISGHEEPRLFAAADYLRAIFQAGADDAITVQTECQLLEAYVPLLALNRGLDLRLTVFDGLSPMPSASTRRHLSCDLVNMLIRAIPPDMRPYPAVDIQFEPSRTREGAYVLALTVQHQPVDAFETRMKAELAECQDRMGPHAPAIGCHWANAPQHMRLELSVGRGEEIA